jgi:hypothetical protein
LPRESRTNCPRERRWTLENSTESQISWARGSGPPQLGAAPCSIILSGPNQEWILNRCSKVSMVGSVSPAPTPRTSGKQKFPRGAVSHRSFLLQLRKGSGSPARSRTTRMLPVELERRTRRLVHPSLRNTTDGPSASNSKSPDVSALAKSLVMAMWSIRTSGIGSPAESTTAPLTCIGCGNISFAGPSCDRASAAMASQTTEGNNPRSCIAPLL